MERKARDCLKCNKTYIMPGFLCATCSRENETEYSPPKHKCHSSKKPDLSILRST